MYAIFDTLEYTKGAEKVGIKREHAEYQAQQLAHLLNEQLATKKDIGIVRREMEIMTQQIVDRITIKLGSMMVICTGIIIAVLGFIIKM